LTIEQRYRYLYKPLVLLAGLAPLAWLLCGALGWLDVSLGPDPVKKLEHECGKTALNLLLITLLVTPVRELARLPHLLRLRRTLGLLAFFYVVLHFLIYVFLDLELRFGMVLTEIARRPYLTIGVAALLMLIPLAATSTNRMMRRLGRRWQKLHRLVYLVAILGVWHYYWQVKRDVREPLVYAGILALLLGYRLVRWALRKRSALRSELTATSRSGSATAPERT
jgi:sulfoxide reductase heme-binding subunit YedZ